MKLVDPGPQPSPFKVEYSELESEKPDFQNQNEDVSPNADVSREASTEAVEEPQAAPVAAEVSVTRSAKTAEQPFRAATSSSENAQAEATGGDEFGAGVDVGDEVSKVAGNEKPKTGDESPQQGTDDAKAAATGQKKRGKRPGRRRRSRRGQKNNDGSPPEREA
jgi:hypothetical protein